LVFDCCLFFKTFGGVEGWGGGGGGGGGGTIFWGGGGGGGVTQKKRIHRLSSAQIIRADCS